MCTILLVDDAPDIRLLLKAVLHRSGHEVIEAASGSEALELLDAGLEPSAIILDIQMPGLDGWTTLERIRDNSATLNTPVLMLSVKASPQDKRRAWNLGCDAYVTKPFNIVALSREVEAVVAMSAAERTAVRRARLGAAIEATELSNQPVA